MFTTLRSKIYAGFGAIVAINVVFVLWAISRFSTVGDAINESVVTNYTATAGTMRLLRAVDNEHRRFVDCYRSGAGTCAELLVEDSIGFERLLRTSLFFDGDTSIADQRRDSIRSLYTDFHTAERRIVESGSAATPGAGPLHDSLDAALDRLKGNVYDRSIASREEIDNVREELSSELRQSLLYVGIGTVIAALLGILGSSLYSRWALRPISRLQQAVKGVREGELAQRVLITSGDELGDLSFEFNRMIERLRRYEAMNVEQLLLEKRKVETVVRSIATPILVVGSSMDVLLVNTALLRLFRKPISRNYEGENVRELVGEDGVVELLRNMVSVGSARDGRADASGVIARAENDISQAIYVDEEEGKSRFYAVNAYPLETSLGVSGAVAVFADVTEFKELDRLKSEFLAKISHEFRTPLSSIMMSIDILNEGFLGALNDQQRELLTGAKDDCRRLSKLITDILEISRLESELGRREIEAFDLAKLIDNALAPHRRIAEEKGVVLTTENLIGVPTLYADPEHFRWIVNNLVSNAIRHTSSGGSVSVSAGVADGRLGIIVSDTGSGIPLDSIRMIFERFYQVDDETNPTPGSVGLGLAITREVVESYGGTIVVDSELNVGSTFTVTIPMERLRREETANERTDGEGISA